jgi:intein/homing endonuclease
MNDFYTIARINGGAIAWTDEQVTYIIDKYLNENYTLKQLGREFNCNYATIRNLLNRHNIKSRGNKQGYPRNEYYFNKIDNKDKAYWLGFLYADGCTHSTRNEISIGITDEEHVEKFKIAIGAINHKITVSNDERWKNAKPIYHFSIKDAQLHKDLERWGCVANKTFIISKIPNIPRDYVSHFIRGYFDGDGSLHYLKSTNNYRISFTCGSKSFLEDIRKELNLEKISIGKQKDTNTYYFQISGRKQVVKILGYLYKDSTEEIRLNRKYENYLDCLKWALRH